ncbi:MAG TPA: hypothetical protein PLU70_04300 [Thermotogota bacterium]|nr:hypothetical protein [Thermotogota bacterium]OQC31355.1 MAG: hypothetical protein BWX67_01179 [Thermotogota bacterium ADurb.Bin062]HNY82659.1 hypothetical protein [Thermotogota bacterium]HOD91216.1 hypothetical protein [Thermotogota bacterium]HOF23814.1 hypothetical protein [Thermotogota bacterium]
MEERNRCRFPEESREIVERFRSGQAELAFLELKHHIKECPVCAQRFEAFCVVNRLFTGAKREALFPDYLQRVALRCERAGIALSECMTLYEVFIAHTYTQNMNCDSEIGKELSLAQEFYDLLEVNLPVGSRSTGKPNGFLFRWATLMAPVTIALVFALQWVSGPLLTSNAGLSMAKGVAFPTFDTQAYYTPKEAYTPSKVEPEYRNYTLPVDNALRKTYDLSFDSEETSHSFKIINISFK